MDTYAPVFIVEIDGSELPEDISRYIEDFSYDDHEDKMDELSIRIADAELSFIEHPQLQEGKEIRARWGYLGNLSEVRTCTIKKIDYDFTSAGILRMNISALDKGHKLTGRSARTCWNNKTVADIASDIAKKHNLTPVLDIPNDSPREFVSEGGKNDMVFLRGLAAEHGCLLWVRNDELHIKPNTVTESVMKFRYREDRDGYLQSLRITSKAEEGKGTDGETETAGVEPLSKREIKETARAKESGLLVNLETGRIGNETPYQAKDDETGKVVPTPSHSRTRGKQESKGIVQSSAMKGIEATATTIGIPALKAKDSVTIENIGKKFSGDWRVKSVKHQISRRGYTCSLTLAKSDIERGTSAKKDGTHPPKVKASRAPKHAGSSKTSSPPPVEVNLS